MPASAVIIRSFASGEISPSISFRADLAKYAVGLRTCRNFQVRRHGGVSNRAGTRMINELKTATSNKRLFKYISEQPGGSMLIEAGNGYFRFYLNGALVVVDPGDVTAWSGATDYVIGDLALEGGLIYYCIAAHTNQQPPDALFWAPLPADHTYELPSPFTADLAQLTMAQSGRVLSFAHPEVQPHDLTFEDVTRFVLEAQSTGPQVTAPVNVMLTEGGGVYHAGYLVTAAHPLTYEESLPSAQVISLAAAEPTPEAPHQIDWDHVSVDGTQAPEYYVYYDPFGNGTYGFIGTATGQNQFLNPGLVPDFLQTPPILQTLFENTDEHPGAVAYYQQRRFYARSNTIPDGVWGSQVGLPRNFNISSPVQDDDAVVFRLAGNNHQPVRFLVGLKRGLIVLTDAGEWRVGREFEALTPSNIPADQETYTGTSSVPPAVVGRSILYVQARGRTPRDLRFDEAALGLAGGDLSVFAGHLFDKYTLTSLDYQQVPDSTVWYCRSDGTLLGLTYLPEQDVMAWHRHDTGASGRFEQVCVVPELDEDVVYVIVRRTIGGQIVRYLERLERREIETWNTDVFFVDSGLSYSGSAVSSVSGLDHLEGQTVAVVGDGAYLGTATVSGGAVTLPGGVTASDIHVGLPITADLETLNLDTSGSDVRDRKKRVQGMKAALEESVRSYFAGQSFDALVQQGIASTDDQSQAFTGEAELNFFSRFDPHGRVVIRHTHPLPLTVLGLMPYDEVGG